MGKGALCAMADPFMQDIRANGAAVAKLEAGRAGKLPQPQSADRGLAFAAQCEACREAHQIIHQIMFEQGSRKRAATFAKHGCEAPLAKRMEYFRDIEVRGAVYLDLDEFCAERSPCLLGWGWRIRAMQKPERGMINAGRQSALTGQVQLMR